MCISFGSRALTPVSTPAPIQPRQPDLVSAARLPSKKELLDPDDVAGVEYGTNEKTGEGKRGEAKRTGTDALKININTGAGGGGSTGGLNV
tara:strand:- start:2354 stop:2626 length:273 start_codon:yes stop_codon:yes gene_type:complete